jgi:hypothetical protein
MTDTYYMRNRERIKQRNKELDSLDPTRRVRRIARSRQYNSEHAEHMRAVRNAWVEENPSWDMYKNARARSIKFNLPFDIKYTDIIIPSNCPVFGIPLDRSTPEHRPTLDRIVPELGYVKGNICVISDRANRKKQDSSREDLEKIVNYIKSFEV